MMHRKTVGVFLSIFLSVAPLFASDPAKREKSDSTTNNPTNTPPSRTDRDVSPEDLKGIPKGHRYLWSIVGGTALGAGLGALGGTKGAGKGAIIGGSAASAFYLFTHRHTGGSGRPLAIVATNALLFGGLGWLICDCGDGMGIGLLIGGGGTAVIQAFGTHHRTLAKATGANDTTPPPPSDPSVPAPPPPPPPQPNKPQENNHTDNPQPKNLPEQ